jgi:hypothetical protein
MCHRARRIVISVEFGSLLSIHVEATRLNRVSNMLTPWEGEVSASLGEFTIWLPCCATMGLAKKNRSGECREMPRTPYKRPLKESL